MANKEKVVEEVKDVEVVEKPKRGRKPKEVKEGVEKKPKAKAAPKPKKVKEATVEGSKETAPKPRKPRKPKETKADVEMAKDITPEPVEEFVETPVEEVKKEDAPVTETVAETKECKCGGSGSCGDCHCGNSGSCGCDECHCNDYSIEEPIEKEKKSKLVAVIISLVIVAVLGCLAAGAYFSSQNAPMKDEVTGDFEDTTLATIGYFTMDDYKQAVPVRVDALGERGYSLDYASAGVTEEDIILGNEIKSEEIPVLKDGVSTNVVVTLVNTAATECTYKEGMVYSLIIKGESSIKVRDNLGVGSTEADFNQVFTEAIISRDSILKYRDADNGVVIVTLADGKATQVEYVLMDKEVSDTYATK